MASRRQFLFLLALLGAGTTANAQPERTYRVVYLTGGALHAQGAFIEAFLQGMASHGYVRGSNLVFETRSADGNFARLPGLAREAIALKPDVLFVSTTPASLAAKAATSKLPIVFVGVADPVGVGLVTNLARPEANVTGVTNIVAELTGKRMALLRELIPGVARIAVLVNPDDPNAAIQLSNAREAAGTLGMQLEPVVHVRKTGDLDAAFEAAARAGAGAALRMVDPTTSMLRAETVRLAAKHRLPMMFPFREDAEAGGLAAYGASLPEQYRQAAGFVHRILRGARPSELPVERPTKFEFVINVKAAKALGVEIPRPLLLQADRLIE